MARRYENGQELWNEDDFVPTDPVMIERYVFNGRKASLLGRLAAEYTVPELLPSSPRNRE